MDVKLAGQTTANIEHDIQTHNYPTPGQIMLKLSPHIGHVCSFAPFNY